MTYCCPDLDPPLGRYAQITLMHVRGLEHFILTMGAFGSGELKIKVFVKHYALGGNKVQKAIFSFNVSQGHKVIELGVIERVLLVEYASKISKVSISCGSKVKAKVKVDNRRTNLTKTICIESRIIRPGGIDMSQKGPFFENLRNV